MNEFIYKPPSEALEPYKTNYAVKFSSDIFLLKSYLDQKNIPYTTEELEESLLGLGLRIKR